MWWLVPRNRGYKFPRRKETRYGVVITAPSCKNDNSRSCVWRTGSNKMSCAVPSTHYSRWWVRYSTEVDPWCQCASVSVSWWRCRMFITRILGRLWGKTIPKKNVKLCLSAADATYCTSCSAVRPKFVLYVREHLSRRSEQRLDPINIKESQITHTWGGNQTRAHGWGQSTNYHTQYRIGFRVSGFRFDPAGYNPPVHPR